MSAGDTSPYDAGGLRLPVNKGGFCESPIGSTYPILCSVLPDIDEYTDVYKKIPLAHLLCRRAASLHGSDTPFVPTAEDIAKQRFIEDHGRRVTFVMPFRGRDSFFQPAAETLREVSSVGTPTALLSALMIMAHLSTTEIGLATKVLKPKKEGEEESSHDALLRSCVGNIDQQDEFMFPYGMDTMLAMPRVVMDMWMLFEGDVEDNEVVYGFRKGETPYAYCVSILWIDPRLDAELGVMALCKKNETYAGKGKGARGLMSLNKEPTVLTDSGEVVHNELIKDNSPGAWKNYPPLHIKHIQEWHNILQSAANIADPTTILGGKRGCPFYMLGLDSCLEYFRAPKEKVPEGRLPKMIKPYMCVKLATQGGVISEVQGFSEVRNFLSEPVVKYPYPECIIRLPGVFCSPRALLNTRLPHLIELHDVEYIEGWVDRVNFPPIRVKDANHILESVQHQVIAGDGYSPNMSKVSILGGHPFYKTVKHRYERDLGVLGIKNNSPDSAMRKDLHLRQMCASMRSTAPDLPESFQACLKWAESEQNRAAKAGLEFRLFGDLFNEDDAYLPGNGSYYIDNRLSPFGNVIARMYIGLERLGMSTFHRLFFLEGCILLAAYDSRAHVMQLSLIVQGPAETGKSHIVDELKEYMIPGTIIKKGSGSKKSGMYDPLVMQPIVSDEFYEMGVLQQSGNKGAQDTTTMGDSYVKQMLSDGTGNYSVTVQTAEGRRTVNMVIPKEFSHIINANGDIKNCLHAPFLSRYINISVVKEIRPGYGHQDQGAIIRTKDSAQQKRDMDVFAWYIRHEQLFVAYVCALMKSGVTDYDEGHQCMFFEMAWHRFKVFANEVNHVDVQDSARATEKLKRLARICAIRRTFAETCLGGFSLVEDFILSPENEVKIFVDSEQNIKDLCETTDNNGYSKVVIARNIVPFITITMEDMVNTISMFSEVIYNSDERLVLAQLKKHLGFRPHNGEGSHSPEFFSQKFAKMVKNGEEVEDYNYLDITDWIPDTQNTRKLDKEEAAKIIGNLLLCPELLAHQTVNENTPGSVIKSIFSKNVYSHRNYFRMGSSLMMSPPDVLMYSDIMKLDTYNGQYGQGDQQIRDKKRICILVQWVEKYLQMRNWDVDPIVKSLEGMVSYVGAPKNTYVLPGSIITAGGKDKPMAPHIMHVIRAKNTEAECKGLTDGISGLERFRVTLGGEPKNINLTPVKINGVEHCIPVDDMYGEINDSRVCHQRTGTKRAPMYESWESYVRKVVDISPGSEARPSSSHRRQLKIWHLNSDFVPSRRGAVYPEDVYEVYKEEEKTRNSNKFTTIQADGAIQEMFHMFARYVESDKGVAGNVGEQGSLVRERLKVPDAPTYNYEDMDEEDYTQEDYYREEDDDELHAMREAEENQHISKRVKLS